MINPLEKITAYLDARREMIKERILYGLTYSGLTMKWWSLRCYMMLLDIPKRKLQKMHINCVSTANRVWGERDQLGRKKEEKAASARLCSVKELGPDKAEKLTDAEECLIVDEVRYEEEMDQPSEEVATS